MSDAPSGSAPADLSTWLQPVPHGAVFREDGYNVWCGAPARGDDGRWHLFYARWPRSSAHHGWLTHAEIARATAAHMLGPYRPADVPLPTGGRPRWDGQSVFNPTLVRDGDRWLLYYTGVAGPASGERPDWDCRNRQRIGVAVATRLEGPWQRADVPLVDASDDLQAPDALFTSNPAVCRRPDGGWLMVYKGAGRTRPLPRGGPVVLLVATADDPTGPWHKQLQPVFTRPGVDFAAEDPFIWHDGRRWRAIVKDMQGRFTRAGCSLAQFESADGLAWAPSATPLLCGLDVTWEGGQVQRLAALERPQLVIEQGVPRAMFCAVAASADRDHSFNLHWPMAAPHAGGEPVA